MCAELSQAKVEVSLTPPLEISKYINSFGSRDLARREHMCTERECLWAGVVSSLLYLHTMAHFFV